MRKTGTTPSALSWSLILHHCPSNCHTHPLQTFAGVSSGSFTAPTTTTPPTSSWSNRNRLRRLTGTASVTLQPQTVNLTFNTSPSGLQLVLNGGSAATPFTRTVIAGSNNSVSAPSPQTLNGSSYGFASWSDGGAQTHNIIASSTATYTAVFLAPPTNTSPPAITGPTMVGEPSRPQTGAGPARLLSRSPINGAAATHRVPPV